MRRRALRPGISGRIASALALGAAACSSFYPQVGPSQESCGVEPLHVGSTGGSEYGASAGDGYDTSGAADGPPSDMCSIDAGSACDDCESKWCCPTRLACYEDPVCVCADMAMDVCLASANASPKVTASCWASFTATGNVEAARVACERAWCTGPCAIPAP